MKNNLLILGGTVAVLSLVAACESTPTSKPPGEYKSTYKTTNSAGTTTKTSEKTKVYYDNNGQKRAVKETETTKDPKGLFNKSTTSTTKTYN